jgi:hypothetical protein
MGLGYTCNEIPIYSLKYQEEVKKPKALTERGTRLDTSLVFPPNQSFLHPLQRGAEWR